MYSELTLVESERPTGFGYHFCVSHYGGAPGIIAFRTYAGYKRYLQRTGLVPEYRETHYRAAEGRIKIYVLHGQYDEIFFWSLKDLPAKRTAFKGLSNGRYVTCYYADVDGVRTIFRPNPNAEEVYDAVGFAEHRRLTLAD